MTHNTNHWWVGDWTQYLVLMTVVKIPLAVLINYYLWNWVASMFGWSEIGVLWVVLITFGISAVAILGRIVYRRIKGHDPIYGKES